MDNKKKAIIEGIIHKRKQLDVIYNQREEERLSELSEAKLLNEYNEVARDLEFKQKHNGR